jgi:hypothetical protein
LLVWNHGIWIGFPETVGEWNVIIPTDKLHHFSKG